MWWQRLSASEHFSAQQNEYHKTILFMKYAFSVRVYSFLEIAVSDDDDDETIASELGAIIRVDFPVKKNRVSLYLM